MYSFRLNEGQHVCTPEGTMYDPYYIRLLQVIYILCNLVRPNSDTFFYITLHARMAYQQM